MKIGITGATGCVDFGDYAMLVNNMHHIHGDNDAVEFVVFTYNQGNARSAIEENYSSKNYTLCDDPLALMGTAYGNLPNSEIDDEARVMYTEKWESLFQSYVRGENVEQLAALTKQIRECDVLVFNGGGYLNKNWLFRIYAFLLMIVIAKREKVKVVMFPQTYGPFDDASLKSIKEVFPLVDRFYCRDRIYSKQVLLSLGVDESKIRDTMDDLFLLSHDLTSGQSSGGAVKAPLFVQLHRQLRDQLPNIAARFANLIVALKEDDLIDRVVFVPFHHSPDNELKLANEIAAEVAEVIDCEVLEPTWNVGSIVGQLLQARAVICSRYHPLVVALRHRVPIVNILAADNNGEYEYYQAKNRGICEYAGVAAEDVCIQSNANDLMESIHQMLKENITHPKGVSLPRLSAIEQEREALWSYVATS
jgi:polysaccharide pyruvyl transferase WcaK-like protein